MCRTGPVLCAWLLIVSAVSVKGQATDPVSDLLRRQQLDLATDGHAFLLTEASRASFLLIGGLHGDQQTPALVDRVVTGVERFGYRVVAVEMSPWAAGRLEASLKNDEGMAVRGADIEELQPHLLIRELAAVNPGNQALQSMAEMTRTGYRRSQAAELLKSARPAGNVKDISQAGSQSIP